MTYQKICALLAARRCREAGQSVKQIAASARKSESTIRRWLKKGGWISTASGRAMESGSKNCSGSTRVKKKAERPQ